MKKGILAIFCILFSHFAVNAQNPDRVEGIAPELLSAELGAMSLSLSYERALGRQFSVNALAVLSSTLYGGESGLNYFVSPVFSLKPRYYYNFDKRARKGRKVINNSADFLMLSGSYYSDFFTITNTDRQERNFLLLTPMWGMRRTLGKRITFEFALGYGLVLRDNGARGMAEIDLRLGYVFTK